MTAWTPDRIPISMAPLPAEALDSWIAAYARRLHTTSNGLVEHIGLPGVRITRMALKLREHEAAVLQRATGVDLPVLSAMTLEAYDGLAIAIRPDRRTLARPPAGRFSGTRARYCPACLRDGAGRGPLTWRLPWSFACPLHRVLLLDFCPHCHRPPRPWNTRRLGPQAPGACTRDNPASPPGSHRRRSACGTDLTCAPAIPLPASGLVLAAHRRLAELLASTPVARPAALTELKQVYALARRALHGLHSIPDRAPRIVHTVLDECRAQQSDLASAEVGHDARTTAIGAALSRVALDEGHPDHDAVFDWVLQADRSLLNRQHKLSIGARADRWSWSGPDLVNRVLGKLDGEANLHGRLRYATATVRPRWPDLPADAITRRAAMIPAMLWPGWTMRLLPPPPDRSSPQQADPRANSFRRGCSGFLLLPGGPPQLNFERVGPLLGNHQRDPDRDAVERGIYQHHDLTPLASILAQLAFALDEHGSLIDYARRRALFTDATVTLDRDAYARLRLQHGLTTRRTQRTNVLRWYLLLLLTGEHHPAPPGAKKPFAWHCAGFRVHAPRPLRAFLHRQAQANLARHGITEPVTWEPPAHWVTWQPWPGVDPDSINQHDLATLLDTTDSVHDTAVTLSLASEHIRLHREITDAGTPPATTNVAPFPPSRADILEPEHLRDLYEHQHLPLTDIAEMARCSPITIRRLLHLDGVPQRANYRRPPPESGITRAWLQREYLDNLRSISELAGERGVTAYYLANLAKTWGLSIRPPSHYNGIGHLNLPTPPSPAIRAVTTGRGALGRLALITQIPGHTSFTAAAHAIYDGRGAALRQRVRDIETAAGFTVIDRSTTPLTPTKPGRAFLREALQILQTAQETTAGTPVPTPTRTPTPPPQPGEATSPT